MNILQKLHTLLKPTETLTITVDPMRFDNWKISYWARLGPYHEVIIPDIIIRHRQSKRIVRSPVAKLKLMRRYRPSYVQICDVEICEE